MKISLDWLGDYLEWTQNDSQEIARKITAHTAEVDEVEQQGALMDRCCVGKVTSLQPHPDADRLSVCKVQTDDGVKDIVCGGTNLREGMVVAFAHVGAKVRSPDGSLFELSKAKIRGETSEGMICAAEELDLTDRFPPTAEQGKRPVVDLGDDDAAVGQLLREYLGLTDTVLHIDNHAITHRPDLFSHIGFARECVAIGIAKWKKDPLFEAPEFTKDKIPFGFKIKNKALMPRYCSCIIEIEGLGETPDWMKRRLEATGWRSINLPIDITNYVMMEVGVPLHSFDADDIKGTVQMRQAKKGEKMVTLDGAERELSEGALILSDDEGIFDLLGIMGGLRSSTKDTTKRIYLHSASLDPVSIRNAMIQMGHRTDAGTTYEKGVPAVVTEQGFYRAAQLMLELIPGAKIGSVMDSVGDNGSPASYSLSVTRCNDVLGLELTAKQMSDNLTALGFSVEEKGDVLEVSPPLWRLKDITGSHDLIEEVGRIYGFDDIEPVMPMASTVPPARDQRTNQVRDALQRQDYIELMPLSIVGPDLLRQCNVDPSLAAEIENPLGEELSLIAPSALPRLLEQAEEQLRQVSSTLKTFHIGHVSMAGTEYTELLMLVTPKQTPSLKSDPFLITKADMEEALHSIGLTVRIEPADSVLPFAHPGRYADVFIGEEKVGQILEVLPQVRERFGLPHRASVVLLHLEKVLDQPSTVAKPTPAPQFPAVTYDETIDFDHGRSVRDLLTQMREKSELLEEVRVADLYGEDSSAKKAYKLTLHFVYRSVERTLAEDEVKKEHEKVLAVAK